MKTFLLNKAKQAENNSCVVLYATTKLYIYVVFINILKLMLRNYLFFLDLVEVHHEEM